MIYRFWSTEDWYRDYPSKKAFLKDMIESRRLVKIKKGVE